MNIVLEEDNNFAATLKQWRKRRRLSQMELASLAEVSARHISFLEKNRAKPSREMVLKLGNSLDISPIDINAGLTAAGFSHVYPKAELNDKSVKVLHNIIQTMLDKQMPWPGVACDDSWNILNANSAAQHLFELIGLSNQTNLLQAMLLADDPEGAFLNWPEVTRLMLRRIETEKLKRNGDDSNQLQILKQLADHPRLKNLNAAETSTVDLFIPIKVRANNEEISLISMVAEFGAVQEITYSGLHVELFFPADEVTQTYFNDLHK